MKILILNEHEIRRCIPLDAEVIEAVEKAFTRLAEGQATVPPIVGIEVPERRGELDIKAAYIHGLDSFAVKIASGFFENEADGLPVAGGMMMIFSAITGFPQAALFDNGYLTQVRTGAAGSIAARYLARDRIKTAGVIGTGLQGRFQIHGLGLARSFDRLFVYDLNPIKAHQYALEMACELGVEVVEAPDAETVVRESDVLVTTTPSRSPYLEAEWLHPGLHITAMGSDMEEKQELHTSVFANVDRIFCDLKSQCLVRGELHHAYEAGVLSEDHEIIELGEIALGRKLGRRNNDEITVCDLTGVGVQDTAIARVAHRKALASELGAEIEV
jgi:ornithine cyclodeaminase